METWAYFIFKEQTGRNPGFLFCPKVALSVHRQHEAKLAYCIQMFIQFNKNPKNKRVGDCVIRAISTVLDKPWEVTYTEICDEGFLMKDMPSSNAVWGEYLRKHGFYRNVIPNTCPACYTVRDFCMDHRRSRYVLATGTHVIAVINGDYYDTWDSGSEIPIYFWKKNEVI